MKKDTVVSLKKPVEESDPLTALLRAGARQLLCEAVAIWGQTSPNWRNFLIIKLKYFTKRYCTTLRPRFSCAKIGL